MKKLLIAIFFLTGCAHTQKEPVGRDWVTVSSETGLPVAAYNPITRQSQFYTSPENAFAATIEAFLSHLKTHQPPPPSPSEPKPTQAPKAAK